MLLFFTSTQELCFMVSDVLGMSGAWPFTVLLLVTVLVSMLLTKEECKILSVTSKVPKRPEPFSNFFWRGQTGQKENLIKPCLSIQETLQN